MADTEIGLDSSVIKRLWHSYLKAKAKKVKCVLKEKLH